MARKKEKEITCTVEITEGASDRLTSALVDLYYQRKKRGEPLPQKKPEKEGTV